MPICRRLAGYGAHPELPAPQKSLIPTEAVPSVSGWKQGMTPKAAPGLKVVAFAKGLEHPRWLYVLPNGDVLVAEADKGTSFADSMGYGGWIETWVRWFQGLGVKKPPIRSFCLRDTDGDGVADMQNVFLAGLNVPIGMALVGDTLYVADTDALLAFPYRTGETSIAEAARKVTDLPGGPIDHHWTKNVIAQQGWQQALCHHRLQQQCPARTGSIRKPAAPTSGKWIPKPGRTRFMPRACAIPTAWAGRLPGCCCGPRSMNATSWAAISCPIT